MISIWNRSPNRSQSKVSSYLNLSQPMSPTPITSSHSAVPAHEYVLRENMIAQFTLQVSSVTPCPLGVSVVLATNFFMSSKVFNNLLEEILAVYQVGFWRKLLLNSLVCHICESVLMPERALACLPHFSTNVTEFSTTPIDCQYMRTSVEK